MLKHHDSRLDNPSHNQQTCLKLDKPKPFALVTAVRASILTFGLASGSSQAASINVTSALDDNGIGCTLREALTSVNLQIFQDGCSSSDANSLGTNDIINLDDTPGDTITLTGSSLLVTAGSNVTIQASNASGRNITIDANHQSRIFFTRSATLQINNLTLINGSASLRGGAIEANRSTLSITNSTITGNSVDTDGGGVETFLSLVSITNSTISGNTAGRNGGGIDAYAATSVSIINSTITGNSADRSGGIFIYSYFSESNISLSNSIIANSTGGDCSSGSDLGGVNITSDTASIIEDGSCNTAARTGDPGLLPLADNGGSTLTHALSKNSIARNSGILATCTIYDQLGVVRNDGDGTCSVGAVESFFKDDVEYTYFYVIPTSDGKTVVVPL